MEFQGNQSELTKVIIAAAIEVHREFGCGLKEEAYEAALAWELGRHGLKVERQVPCPVVYKGMVLCERDEHPKRIDMIVEDKVVVELKAVSRDEPVFAAQCLTYLKMMNLQVGLVLNFGFPTLKEGIRHVLNDRTSTQSPCLRVRRKQWHRACGAQRGENGGGEARRRLRMPMTTKNNSLSPFLRASVLGGRNGAGPAGFSTEKTEVGRQGED